MNWIPNLDKAWRMASVRVAGAAIAWGLLPEPVQASILGAVGVPANRVPAILGALVLIARLIAQPKVGP